jgi:hypothetical protein
MGSLIKLLEILQNNLKSECCTKSFIVNSSNLSIKLFETITDAGYENDKYSWYKFNDLVELNNKINRPKGISFHKSNNKCGISLIIDQNENTRFFVAENLEIQLNN